MLAHAADWRPGGVVRSSDELLAQPEVAHYVAGWPLAGDVGFIAEDDAPLGATWWRFLPADTEGREYPAYANRSKKFDALETRERGYP